MANEIQKSTPANLMDIGPKKPGTPAAKKVLERNDLARKKRFAKELAKRPAAAQPARSSEKTVRASEEKAAEATKNSSNMKLRHQRSTSLKPLKKAVRQNLEMIRDVPVLAFLNGQLDRIQPAQIPQMVSSNGFITGALAEGDVGEFLAKEMSVEDILADLGIPESVVTESVNGGLNLKQVVTPSDMLRSIGVDPSRVQAELTNLRDNIQGRGLSTYMQKAASMRGILPGQNFANAQDPTKPISSPAASGPNSNISGLAGNSGIAGSVAMPKLSGGTPFENQRALAQHPNGQNTGVFAPQMAPSTHLNSSPQMMAPTASQPQASLNPLSTSNEILQAPPGALAQGPTASKAEIDPIKAMDQRLVNADVVRVGDDAALRAPVAENVKLEENLMGRQLGGQRIYQNIQGTSDAEVSDGTRGFSPVLADMKSAGEVKSSLSELAQSGFAQKPNGQFGNVIRPESQYFAQVDAEQEVISQNKFKAQIGQSQVASKAAFGASQMTGRAPTKQVSIDELQLDMSKFNIDSDDLGSKDGNADQDLSEGDTEQGSEFLNRHVGNQILSSGQSKFATGSGFDTLTKLSNADMPASMSTANRAQLVQKIMDQATAMVKNGNGSMNINLNDMGIGQLEMAVSLNNERIDLKIVTDSDRVREMIGAELAALRDALSVQKLELGSVDVGIEGREEKDSGLFDQQQKQGRQFQEETANQFKDNLRDFGFSLENDIEMSTVAARPRINQLSAPMNIRNNGHIEVRV